MLYNRFIKNPIMKVFWAGWESDTLTLQNNGWQLAVEEDIYRMQMRIAIFNPAMKLYGFQKDFVHYVRTYDGSELPPLVISGMAPQISFLKFNTTMNYNYQPINAEPQFCEQEIKSLSDMAIFRPLQAINEIVVEPKNVDEMLSRILELQSPMQAELREKARLEERRNRNVVDFNQYREVYNPKTDIVAQVISL